MDRTIFGTIGLRMALLLVALLLAIVAIAFGSFPSLAAAVILLCLGELVEWRQG